MKLKKTFLILLLIPLLSFKVHKFYLSLTQINYKKEAKSLQIITNVFMDDIELALNKDYNIDLQLTTKKELKNNDVYFEKYLKDKLEFKVDGNIKPFNYLGKEYEADLVLFYIEIPNIASVKKLEVSNKILIRHFPDQKNLVKTKINNINKSIILNKNETSGTFNH
ncbi:MAG: hypothetical protein HWD82_00495 [Flavobacteriaceae bacterium]|nr:hypothetical protein [Flavobacteriaceae bacterium]